MLNSNSSWITENPLFKNKNQRYYYDFGTEKQIEREDIRKERDDFLEGFNSVGIVKKDGNGMFQNKEPKITKLPFDPSQEVKIEKLPGDPNKPLTLVQYASRETNDPWGSTLGGDLNSNKDKELFLEGFNQASKEEGTWKNALGTGKTGEIQLMSNPISTGKELVNKASSWANEKGFLDDITNTFFKLSDLSQDYLMKILPTDLVHLILANVNQRANENVMLGSYNKEGGYINDQGLPFSQINNIRYGIKSASDNGCGIIAVNNALVSLGNRQDIRDIAKDFEKDGQVLFGAFGTNPYAIGDYFKKQGYQVASYQGDETIKNLDIPVADTYILTYWNSDKAMDGVHIVSVDRLDNGKYRIYNAAGGKTLEVNSLSEYFIEENRIPLVLHCIKKG